MVTVMLIGQLDCCEKARALIEEAMVNKGAEAAPEGVRQEARRQGGHPLPGQR